MKRIISFFALMTLCVMASARGLSPPVPDLAKENITVVVADEAQPVALVSVEVPFTDVEFRFLPVSAIARDAVLNISDLKIWVLLPADFEFNRHLVPEYNVFTFSGYWQSFY